MFIFFEAAVRQICLLNLVFLYWEKYSNNTFKPFFWQKKVGKTFNIQDLEEIL
jgi:hypothetical protein